jgi:hypothetical protein
MVPVPLRHKFFSIISRFPSPLSGWLSRSGPYKGWPNPGRAAGRGTAMQRGSATHESLGHCSEHMHLFAFMLYNEHYALQRGCCDKKKHDNCIAQPIRGQHERSKGQKDLFCQS